MELVDGVVVVLDWEDGVDVVLTLVLVEFVKEVIVKIKCQVCETCPTSLRTKSVLST